MYFAPSNDEFSLERSGNARAPSAPMHEGKTCAMEVRIRPSTPDDEPAIVALMRNAGLNPDAVEGWLKWKYWQERLDWPGARSFVVASESEIFAHSGIVPGICIWNNHRATVIHMIDWAASRGMVGAGVAIMKHIRGLADALIGVGGSQYTRQAFRVFGLRPCGTTTLYVRALHPLLGLKDRGHWNWKTLPKLGRDALWALWAPTVHCDGWHAPRIAREQLLSIASVLPSARADMTVLERSIASLTYFLDCPIAPMVLHALEKNGERRGYFLLAFAAEQARLVDCWVDSEDPGDWRAMLNCAVHVALQTPGIAELATLASDPILSQCALQSGFRARWTEAVHILPKPESASIPTNLRFQMLDSDAAYLQTLG
jgi:hypothetical protein